LIIKKYVYINNKTVYIKFRFFIFEKKIVKLNSLSKKDEFNPSA